MIKNSIKNCVLLLVVLGVCAPGALAGIWTNPSSFDVNIIEGCAEANTLMVGNSGPGELNFTVRTHIVGGSGGSSVGIDGLGGKTAILPQIGSVADAPYKSDELIVRFAPKSNGVQMNTEEKHSAMKSLGGAVVKREFKLVPGLSVVKLPAGVTVEMAIEKLKKTSGIMYVHPNYQVKALGIPNDTRFGELWGMHNTGQTGGMVDADIDAPEAWDIGTGSNEVIVAVIDTGVDYTHPDLAANMWVNEAEYSGTPGVDDDGNGFVDDIYGYDFVNEDGNPMDDHYHGTHCSGTIGALGNNGLGVAGVCWNVRIMALKFLDSGGSGWSADAIQCIEYSVQMGANLSSNSWGGGGYDQGLKDAIEAAGAAGMLFVAAAGNSNSDNDQYPHYPSSYDSPSIIAVMATDMYDNKSGFSCWGLISVDIGAPGGDGYPYGPEDILSTVPGGSYAPLAGTSMATPHVAGACALLWSMNPDMSNSEIKDILLRTVDPTLPGLCVSGGRLNIYNAILETKVPWIIIEPEEGTIGPGQSVDLSAIFDAIELEPGTYQAEIVIISNDVTNPRLAILVTMIVNQDALTVSPAERFESSGRKGEPFEPACTKYTLYNRGVAAVNWEIQEIPGWLEVTPAEGVLQPGVTIDVNVCISSCANALDPNIYTALLTFENLDSSSIKPRLIVLTVKPPDLFTQSFDAGGVGLESLSLTLRPNGSIACYEACRDHVNEFPTDPNGGTYLLLWDDDYAEVVLTGGKEVMFYGQSYDSFYVGSNGYITFGSGDTEYDGSLENHFNLPRMSGHFTDLIPVTGQSISFKQLEDRVAVTFIDVPIFGDKTAKNSFQMELFFGDGTLRITWLKLATVAGIAGVSEGKGLPLELFEESNLSGYPICWPMGDFTKDYAVNLLDLGVFVIYWLNDDCGYPLWCDRTDLDFSTDVEGVDFSVFAQNWGVIKSTMPPPVAWWKFDEGEGTIAHDSAGDNDGNLINGPVWTTGTIGGGLMFDGVDDYVEVPYNDSLGPGYITMSAWVQPDIISRGMVLIGKSKYSDCSSEQYDLAIETGGVPYASIKRNSSCVIGQGWKAVWSSRSVTAGQWYFVTSTWDGSVFKIYINGELSGMNSNVPAGLIDYCPGGTLRFGIWWSQGQYPFQGVMDDVRIYNRALTAEEIWQLYREGLTKKAFNPNPADGRTNVDPNTILSWSPGKDAETHNVYFGTDFDEVNEADISDANVCMGNFDANSWDTNNYDSNGLEPNTTFYWRIDEISP
ncbi:MAG: S8 family serine peptidase [Sedimentisphaerales bacterium]|nr:S8 family serine peptidase [Sedimentisphaerales bacterium]